MPSASVSASASRKRSAGSRWLPARTRPASVAATASDGPSPSQPPLTIWCDCRSSWRRQHDRAVSRPRQTARRRLNPDRIRLSQRRSSHPQSQTEHFFNSLLLERLVVSLEANIKKYETSLAKASGQTTVTAVKIEKRFKTMNKNIEKSFDFSGLATRGLATLGIGLS